LLPVLRRQGDRLLVGVDRDAGDLARLVLDQVVDVGRRLRRRLRAVVPERLQRQPDERCDDDQREKSTAEEAVHETPEGRVPPGLWSSPFTSAGTRWI